MKPWWKDFIWSWRGVTSKITHAFIPFSLSFAKDFSTGWFFCLSETLRRRVYGPLSQHTFTVAYLPTPPRPWYLVWAAVTRAGGRAIKDMSRADAVFYFDDSTHSYPPALLNTQTLAFNFECTDISKSKVAQTFEEVFGYSLSVDPETHHGPMVVKSERNGAHDGQVVNGPCPRQSGVVYQRLIDNSVEAAYVQDIRCPTVYGEIPVIYLKRRPLLSRFANMNSTVTLGQTQDWLSREERDNIALFCRKMGLDWGGLDILRDNMDQKIYIVDVNKTDMGPPLALPLKDKLTSTTRLAEALQKAITTARISINASENRADLGQ